MSDTVAESAIGDEPVEVDGPDANHFRWVHFGRILAYWIDTWIVLGIPAKLIAVYRYDDIVRFGVWNTVAGLAIGVAYFTFVPRVLAGCTIGLFCIGARYDDRDGQLPSIPRLAWRGFLLLMLFKASNNYMLIDDFTMGSRLFGLVIIFGVLLSYLFYIFGGKTYRLPHDYLSGIWMVPLVYRGVPPQNRMSKKRIGAMVVAGLGVVLFWFFGVTRMMGGIELESRDEEFDAADRRITESLEALPGVRHAIVYARSKEDKSSVPSLGSITIPPHFSVSLDTREPLSESFTGQCFCEAARLVLAEFPEPGSWETLDVSVSNRVEVLFSQMDDRYEASHSWEAWAGFLAGCDAGQRDHIPFERQGELERREHGLFEILFL